MAASRMMPDDSGMSSLKNPPPEERNQGLTFSGKVMSSGVLPALETDPLFVRSRTPLARHRWSSSIFHLKLPACDFLGAECGGGSRYTGAKEGKRGGSGPSPGGSTAAMAKRWWYVEG